MEEEAQRLAAQANGKTEFAMVVDAAAGSAEGNAVERFVDLDCQRHSDVHLELVLRLVDASELERDLQMQPARARFAAHPLADNRRPRRLDALDAHVVEAAPAGELCEQLPHNVDRGLDDLDGTSGVSCRQAISPSARINLYPLAIIT